MDKRYLSHSEYRDSGDEWVAKTPAHWKVLRAKSIFSLCCEPAPQHNELRLLSVYTDIGVRPRSELEQRGNKASTTDGYWIVKKGDLIVNKLLAWMGAVGWSGYDGVTSPAYDILRMARPLCPKYYHYMFRLPDTGLRFKRSSRGIMEMRLRMYFDEFGKILLPFPPESEQTQIAKFLDYETARIDALIEKQQQLIALLKEKRQAVISHAVTRGLNPNAPMRDSGVEWLGQVPAHWTVSRIKNLAGIISKGTTPSTIGKDLSSSGIRFLKGENVGKGLIVSSMPVFHISKETDKLLARSRLRTGDVLVIIAGATTGLCSIVTNDVLPANTNQAVSFIRPIEAGHSHFIARWLSTEFAQRIIWMGAVQAAQPNLSMEDLGSIPIVVPPCDELHQILNFISVKTAQIELLNERAGTMMNLLQERRTALISAAVTGKIDVRDWQPPDNSEAA